MAQRVLVVEDEPALSKVLLNKLKGLGYATDSASSGLEALKKTEKFKPHLILLDVVMPIMSGFDFLEKLRVEQKNTTPVIIISNLEMKNDVETGRNLGAEKYIVKSNTSIRDLMLAVKNTLDK